jgi:hypothetical protein
MRVVLILQQGGEADDHRVLAARALVTGGVLGG